MYNKINENSEGDSCPLPMAIQRQLVSILDTKEQILNNIDEFAISLADFKSMTRLDDPAYGCIFVPDEIGFYFEQGDKLELVTSQKARTPAQRKARAPSNPEMVNITLVHTRYKRPNKLPVIGQLLNYNGEYYAAFDARPFGGGMEVVPGRIECVNTEPVQTPKVQRKPDLELYMPPALRERMDIQSSSFGKRRVKRKSDSISELDKLIKQITKVLKH
jgi:hypothetical protein